MRMGGDRLENAQFSCPLLFLCDVPHPPSQAHGNWSWQDEVRVFNVAVGFAILLLGMLVSGEGVGHPCVTWQLDFFVAEVSVSLFGNNDWGLGHRGTKCAKRVFKMGIQFPPRPHCWASRPAASVCIVIQ